MANIRGQRIWRMRWPQRLCVYHFREGKDTYYTIGTGFTDGRDQTVAFERTGFTVSSLILTEL